jgi:hypothetical protein
MILQLSNINRTCCSHPPIATNWYPHAQLQNLRRMISFFLYIFQRYHPQLLYICMHMNRYRFDNSFVWCHITSLDGVSLKQKLAIVDTYVYYCSRPRIKNGIYIYIRYIMDIYLIYPAGYISDIYN